MGDRRSYSPNPLEPQLVEGNRDTEDDVYREQEEDSGPTPAAVDLPKMEARSLLLTIFTHEEFSQLFFEEWPDTRPGGSLDMGLKRLWRWVVEGGLATGWEFAGPRAMQRCHWLHPWWSVLGPSSQRVLSRRQSHPGCGKKTQPIPTLIRLVHCQLLGQLSPICTYAIGILHRPISSHETEIQSKLARVISFSSAPAVIRPFFFRAWSSANQKDLI
jgi:hypothetical protein